MEKSDEREWLSTQQLADWLGIDVKALYWLNFTGQAPRRYRVGRELRYRRKEVEAWISKRAVE